MKYFVLLIFIIFGITPAFSATTCTTDTKTYTACKPGYYLILGSCRRCPASNGVYGTTVDNNTNGITSCYLPSGTTGSDTYGDYEIVGNCYYDM